MNINCSRNAVALSSLALVSFLVLTATSLQAHPYASGLTNSAGAISYILNENAE
jgi:hypothetical protein